jgi:hypothetical protein
MDILRRIVKNLLPYYVVKKYQNRQGGNPFDSGNYYSPIPAKKDIEKYDFSALTLIKDIPGIDLNTEEQFELLNKFDVFYKELPFKDTKQQSLRYYFQNGFYSYSDAICLYCMLRHLKPGKVIEAGSGFFSSVTLDTNELFLKNSVQCTFVEPYPDRLKSLLKENDKTNVRILEQRLQDVPLNIFRELSENDILFIDSTHAAKFNSDVNSSSATRRSSAFPLMSARFN